MTPHPGQIIEWDVTLQTYEMFKELMVQIQDYPEDSSEYLALVESIRSLPNFPVGYNPDTAHIIPNVTSITVN